MLARASALMCLWADFMQIVWEKQLYRNSSKRGQQETVLMLVAIYVSQELRF